MTENNRYQGVLFDLDGTLLDTANDLGAALNHVLEQHDMAQVPPEAFRPVASDGAKGLLELGFGDTLTELDYEQLRQQFLRYYRENIAKHTCFYRGIVPLLTALNERNIPWGVVTNKPIALTQKLLPHYPLFEHCAVTVGGDSLAQRKPHPAPLLYASEQLALAPEQCVYVGDALRDIQAGNDAKMATIVAQWGYIADTDVCRSWQADLLAEDPAQILAFIL
ncbi:HAD family hydrolase [Thalassomonas actiniarum]|uniref:HAD-IA family hydrolase n=1 Tax=Thalassomonas actiniarum TaxID=485447 RepID=A0AAF0C1L7_9GAMM|nr:HAD-IA family hydrolase [Thalassomonas actiniarum]WDD96849.1 HAD-IA family hydrolase [Thalassomonas actiniarum]